MEFGSFPGGQEVKNLPANVGDTGLIPGLGRFYMPWGNQACVPLLLSSRACTSHLLKPMCLEPMLGNRRSHRNEEPAHHS